MTSSHTPPEILLQIATHLDVEAYFALLNPRADLFRALLFKHHNHVRHLSIHFDSLLEIAFDTHLIQLTSLHIFGQFASTRRYHCTTPEGTITSATGTFAQTQSDQEPIPPFCRRQLDDDSVLESVFYQDWQCNVDFPQALEWSRKCWQIIVDNPDLQSLRISDDWKWSLLKLAPMVKQPNYNARPFLRPDSEAFVIKTFSRLARLTGLQAGPQVENYVLRHIGYWTNLPAALVTSWSPLFATSRSPFRVSTGSRSTIGRTLPATERIIGDSMGYRVFNEVVVHSNLEHITTALEFRWFRFNIRTPNLRTIGPGVIFRNVQDLMQTLRLCPKLEEVDAAELRGMDDDLSISYCAQQDKQDFEASGGDREAMEWNIRKLVIRSSQHRSYTVPRLLRRIPNLVRLEVGSIPPQAVEIIGKTCGDCLEDVRFYLRDPCYGEMNWFLERCSLLKTVRELGLAVKAKDLMKDAKDEGMTSSGSGGGWTYLGLTELQIKIHGVPRLNARQDAPNYTISVIWISASNRWRTSPTRHDDTVMDQVNLVRTGSYSVTVQSPTVSPSPSQPRSRQMGHKWEQVDWNNWRHCGG
ncbi:hypothetical protein BGX33_000732 [Mortierella sp. NVP41]|nr:hypothetical protein BGX33_000732 [Mortierella sp. NVP41]